MLSYKRSLVASSLLAMLSVPAGASAAEFGNMEYNQNELFETISFFDGDNMPNGPTGSNTALVVNGYLIVMGSFDSGNPNGPIHVFDVTNPRSPERVTTISNANTNIHRELHAMPIANINGRLIVAFTTDPQGVNYWDFTNPETPEFVSRVQFANNGGDYTNATWQLSWTWPYMYAGATGGGVYVVDTTDIDNPTQIAQISVGDLGGSRIGPTHAIGNRLVVSTMDVDPMRITVMDVTDPTNAFQLATGTNGGQQYSSLVVGDYIYSLGGGGAYKFWRWSDDSVEHLMNRNFGGDKGGYCTFQDTFIICGQSGDGFRKINVANVMDPQEVGNGTINRSNADMDFATVMGNLVYLGNDHGTGSAFVPHQMAPDTTPPAIIRGFPADGETNVDLTSRLTVFFTDSADLGSVLPETTFVRTNDGSTIVPGVWTISSFNALTFGPAAPLAADTTYEVVFLPEGMHDIAGNTLPEEVRVRFSTGATLADPEIPFGQGPNPGAGGTGAGGSAPVAGMGGEAPIGGSGPEPVAGAGGTPGTAGAPPIGPGVGGSADPGVGGSAGPPPTGPESPAGCGCATPTSRAPGFGALGLLGAALVLGLRRRSWRAPRSDRKSH